MDGLAVAALCHEWNEQLLRARIDKVHQPAERELVLTVRARDGNVRVLLSAHRVNARAHILTRQRLANPGEPPRFGLLVRRRLEGGRIIAIEQPGWERILHLWVENRDDIGDVVRYALILEIMGKHSNLLLCQPDAAGQPGRVLDSIVHVTPDMSRVRPILPGVPYTLPPPLNKQDVDHLLPAQVAALQLRDLNEKARARTISQTVAGIGPVTAVEAMHRAGAVDDAAFPEQVVQQLRQLVHGVLEGQERPGLGLDEFGRPLAAAPFALQSYPHRRSADSLSDALDELYARLAEHAPPQSIAASHLVRTVTSQMDRLQGKLVKLNEQLSEGRDYDEYRIQGELLTSYAHQVPRGVSEVMLPNYYEEEKLIRIQLDPALSAIENAQRFFRQGSKKKRAIPIVQAQLAQTEADARYLEEVLVHIRDADQPQLAAIREELAEQGFLRRRDRHRRQAPTRKSEAPDTYVSQDGLLMRVGRNNLQNDRLTLRTSHPADIWLHVKDVPGSHVVIAAERQVVPETTLHEAALLAVHFSRVRDSVNVPVDYTTIKQVWKPNGARPGHVLYEGQRTLYVTPDASLLQPVLTRRRT